MITHMPTVLQKLRIISQFLQWVLRVPSRKCDGSDFEIAAVRTSDGTTVRGKIMSTTIHTGHQITAVISPRADDGSPASIDGVPQWTSEQGLVELSPAPDGLSCLIRNRSAVGTDTVTVEADADLGEGVQTILARLELVLEHPRATDLDLTTGEEEPIPAEPTT